MWLSVRLHTLIFFSPAGGIKLPATESLRDWPEGAASVIETAARRPNGETPAVNFPLRRKPEAKFRCYAVARTEEKRGLAYLGCH